MLVKLYNFITQEVEPEGSKVQGFLGYIANLRSTWHTWNPVSKKRVLLGMVAPLIPDLKTEENWAELKKRKKQESFLKNICLELFPESVANLECEQCLWTISPIEHQYQR